MARIPTTSLAASVRSNASLSRLAVEIPVPVVQLLRANSVTFISPLKAQFADETRGNKSSLLCMSMHQDRKSGAAGQRMAATKVARETGLGRESLDKALSPTGNPELTTIMRVVATLGPQLHASPALAKGVA